MPKAFEWRRRQEWGLVWEGGIPLLSGWYLGGGCSPHQNIFCIFKMVRFVAFWSIFYTNCNCHCDHDININILKLHMLNSATKM